MKGKVLGYNKENQTGVITSEEGKRYTFSRADWESPNEPVPNASVDFETEDNRAVGIYRVGGALSNVANDGLSKKWVATILAFIAGWIGVHKFYLGYTKQGIIMLASFLLGWILLGIPSVIVSIIGFIEFCLYLTKSDEAFEETYIHNSRPWF